MSLRGLFGSFRRAGAKAPPADTQTHIAWLIVGLGNPDDRYRRSRHNLGFMALERLAGRLGAEEQKGEGRSSRTERPHPTP